MSRYPNTYPVHIAAEAAKKGNAMHPPSRRNYKMQAAIQSAMSKGWLRRESKRGRVRYHITKGGREALEDEGRAQELAAFLEERRAGPDREEALRGETLHAAPDFALFDDEAS